MTAAPVFIPAPCHTISPPDQFLMAFQDFKEPAPVLIGTVQI